MTETAQYFSQFYLNDSLPTPCLDAYRSCCPDGAKVKKSRFLDYKRDLPSNKESDIKDLLADLSAFANSSGGIILLESMKKEESR
jgi:hypothetical protein